MRNRAGSLTYAIVVASLLSILISSTFLVLHSTEAQTLPTENPADQAQKRAELFLNGASKRMYPQWVGATLEAPQSYYDLLDRLAFYLFDVKKDGKAVGYVVVGSALYKYGVMEGNPGTRPTVPLPSKIGLIVKRDLGLTPEEKEILVPQRLLYLGYRQHYALYQIKDQAVAISLYDERATVTSQLRYGLVPPEQYKQTRQLITTLDSNPQSEWLDLDVPWRDQNDSIIPDDKQNNNNCGPTAGAMVVGYHKSKHGYSQFDNWADDHNALYGFMYTNARWWNPWGGTYFNDAGNGWVAYSQARGYSNFITQQGFAIGDSYDGMRYRLQDQDPLMVMFYWQNPYKEWHWVAVKGYFRTVLEIWPKSGMV